MLIAACPDPECDAPAEIIPWAVAYSTNGPVPHVRTLCANKHRYLLPGTRIRAYDTRPVPDHVPRPQWTTTTAPPPTRAGR
jgi:hypothetical protein